MIFGTENQTKSENPQKHAQSLAHLLYFTETTQCCNMWGLAFQGPSDLRTWFLVKPCQHK